MKKIIIKQWVVLALACFSWFSQAGEVVLSGAPERLPMGPHLDYLQDPSRQLDSSTIISAKPDSAWASVDAPVANFGYSRAAFWYRFTLVNDSSQKRNKIAEVSYPLLDEVSFFQVDPASGEVQQQVHAGDTLPFSQRAVNHRHFLFHISLEPGEQAQFYLRVYSEGSQQVPLTLWEPHAFYVADERSSMSKAMYYGMMLVMVFYNLFIFLSLREKPYLYYVMFLGSFVLMQAALHGTLFQFFWFDAPWLHQRSVLLLLPTAMLFACLFTIEMLELRQRNRFFYRFLMLFVYLDALSIVGAFALPYSLSTTASVAISIPQALGMAIVGPLLWQKGYKAARFFSVAWIAFFIGGIMNAMSKFGLLPLTFITEHGILIGSALEALLLSFALADRFAREKDALYRAQQEKLHEARQRHELEQAMLFKATHSSRTQLPNRVLFNERLEAQIQQHPQESLALVMIHLKRFHEINKTFGHQNANEVLQTLSARLSDEVSLLPQALAIEQNQGVHSYLANIEGVTFAALLKKPHALQQDTYAALARQAQRPVEFRGMALDVGIAIGVAFYPDHGTHAATLMRHAQVATDMAERAESQVAVYAKEINPYSARRLTLMGELSKAIDNDSLTLHFQPQANLLNGDIEGVEALLRWNHPQHGFIPPDEFIPLAEQTGLIKPLTQWVLKAALRLCHDAQEAGFRLNVSINISAMNLHEPDFAEQVIDQVEAVGLTPDRVILEVTESAMMADATRAMTALQALYQAGLRLSIDDFGTGYSSLAYIKKLPVHEIKIDRSFVTDMDQDKDDATIVRTTLNMCHDLGYAVVAEGVENAAVLHQLKAMGCDYAQGYHLSKPLAQAELIAWLQQATWRPLLAPTPLSSVAE